jgi:VanZ like family/Concanavalin A-like lectin/glucanases superfamily
MVTSKTLRLLLGAACLAILGGILVAGLWPFNPRPCNEVKWLDKENGIEFRPDGIIFTDEPLSISPSKGEHTSLEIWLQPAMDDTAPILCIYKRQPHEDFKLLQYGDTLLLQIERGSGLAALEIEHVLHPLQNTFVTITSNPQRTAVYINGVLAKASSHFIVTPGNLSGRLVAGSQPFDYDTWGGQLRALAIYDQELTASQASAHYRSWTNGTAASDAPLDLENAIALYRFDEHRGRLVHNAAAPGPNLVIPSTFSVPQKKFLEPPWASATLDWAYCQDIAINIAGFVPLGFFFCAFLDMGPHPRRLSAPLVAIAIGTGMSLMIEILQFYLPTRDSSLTDVISNTLGTVIGVTLYRVMSTPLLALKRRILKSD